MFKYTYITNLSIDEIFDKSGKADDKIEVDLFRNNIQIQYHADPYYFRGPTIYFHGSLESFSDHTLIHGDYELDGLGKFAIYGINIVFILVAIFLLLSLAFEGIIPLFVIILNDIVIWMVNKYIAKRIAKYMQYQLGASPYYTK